MPRPMHVNVNVLHQPLRLIQRVATPLFFRYTAYILLHDVLLQVGSGGISAKPTQEQH